MIQRRNYFSQYTESFEIKLEHIITDDISTETYCKKYLSHLLQHKKYYLAIYADVLDKLILHSTKKKEDIILIDVGSGNGLLGIFAKFCGFKKVYLNDTDEKFIQASKNLSGELRINIDGYIVGNISSVQLYLQNEKPDAFVGADVIEHVYNLEDMFTCLRQLNPAMVSVFTTGSNPANYLKVRALSKIQLKDELVGGSPEQHILFGETELESFISMREKIIRTYGQALSEKEILQLAKYTRGMNEHDIIQSIDQFKRSGIYPVPAPGNNTCNPMNSSWTERILSFDDYRSIYSKAGFSCKFYAGFYNDYRQGLINFVKKLLNAGITIVGKKISPYIVIVGYIK